MRKKKIFVFSNGSSVFNCHSQFRVAKNKKKILYNDFIFLNSSKKKNSILTSFSNLYKNIYLKKIQWDIAKR